jgi:tRNA threonylcarbamoyl adenosine modification protein (Sua5/YciO/YrdC/YwlC family)
VALLVADLEQAHELCIITGEARALAKRYWPGPLTMVLEAAHDLPPWVGDQARGTVGVRVPQHPVALQLLRLSGTLAVTSANRSGEEPAVSDSAARAIFGDAVTGYLEGEGSAGSASTVLDVTLDPPVVLRQGPIVPD